MSGVVVVDAGAGAARARARRRRAGWRGRAVLGAVGVVLLLAAFQGRAAADGTSGEGTSSEGTAGADAAASGAPGAGTPVVWQPRGTPLAGGAVTADAPPMRPEAEYRDTIKPGETRFYGLALDARVSAAASVFAVPPPGSRVAYGDGLELTLENSDGDRCDSAQAHFGSDSDPRPIGTAVSRLVTGNDADSCQGADQYTLEVRRSSDGTSDPAAWPLELRYTAEPGLQPGATPGPAAAQPEGSGSLGGGDAASSPTPLLTGAVQPAAGGPSFDAATGLRTGIWQTRVLPGETRFYKVPVDWGQQASLVADFSSAQVTGHTSYVGSGVRLTLYSPVRELVDGKDRSYQGAPVSLGEGLGPVAYGNRAADDPEVARERYAGWYYLAVTVHPRVAQAVAGPVPVTLRIDVTGTAQPGPAYDGDERAAGIGVDAHDLASADGTAGGGAAGGSGALRFLGFAGLGAGTALVLALGVWTLAARRGVAAGR